MLIEPMSVFIAHRVFRVHHHASWTGIGDQSKATFIQNEGVSPDGFGLTSLATDTQKLPQSRNTNPANPQDMIP